MNQPNLHALTLPRETPPVTWLLPVRNAMPYLTETLASIAAQTYPNHQVLAWDNGSTDGSLVELKRWIPARIPGQVVSDRPMSLGRCLARMVEEAPTELCARIDADDVNMPDRLSRQVPVLMERRDVSLVGSGMHEIDASGRPVATTIGPYLTDADVRWALRRGNPLRHPTVLFRRAAVLAVGNYRDIKPGQDLDLWIRLATRFKMVNLPDPLIQYRVHAASVTQSHPHSPKVVSRQIVLDHLPDLYPGIDLAAARRLHGLLEDRMSLDVRFTDCKALHRIAVNAALRSGDPGWHFRRTSLYRSQMHNLITRWLKAQPGLSHAWPLLQALRRSKVCLALADRATVVCP